MNNAAANAAKYLGDQNFNNWCQRFVELASQGKTGIYPTAIQAWQSQQKSAVKGMQGVKPGDLVYFTPHASNQGYGHTGIYVGNNQFISATGNGVQQMDIDQWKKMTGQDTLGYVPSDKNSVDFANFHGQQLSGILNQPEPQSQVSQQPTMSQQDQQQGKVNPNVSMPQINNPAASPSAYPLRSQMSNLSESGRQSDAYIPQTGSTIPAVPGGGRLSSRMSAPSASLPDINYSSGASINPFTAPTGQAPPPTVPAAPQTDNSQANQTTTDPNAPIPQTPQTYTFGPISYTSTT